MELVWQHAFIQGRLGGAFRLPDHYPAWGGATFPIRNLAYFCPTCGEVWARLCGAEGKFDVLKAYCEKHQGEYGFQVPGSILPVEKEYAAHLLKFLPLSILQHEAEMHFRHWERTRHDDE